MNVIIPKRLNRRPTFSLSTPDTTIPPQMEPRAKPKKHPRVVILNSNLKPQYNRLNYAHPPLPIRIKNRKVSSDFNYQPPRKIPKRKESFLKLRDSFFGNRSFGNMAVNLVKSAAVDGDEPELSYSDFRPRMTSTPNGKSRECQANGIDEEFIDIGGNDDVVNLQVMPELKRSNPSTEADNSPSKNSKRLRSEVNIFDQTEVGSLTTFDRQMGIDCDLAKPTHNGNIRVQKVKQADNSHSLGQVSANSKNPFQSKVESLAAPPCIVINMFTGQEVETTPVNNGRNAVRNLLSSIASSMMPKVIAGKRKVAKSREMKKKEFFDDTITSEKILMDPPRSQPKNLPFDSSIDNTFVTPPRYQQKTSHPSTKHSDDTIDNLERFIKEPHLSSSTDVLYNYQNRHNTNRYEDWFLGSNSIYDDSAVEQKATEILIDKDQSIRQPKNFYNFDFSNKENEFQESRFNFSCLTPPRHRPLQTHPTKNYYHKYFLDVPNRAYFPESASKAHRNIHQHHNFPDFEMKSIKAKSLPSSKRIPFTQHEFGRRTDFDGIFLKGIHRAKVPPNFEKLGSFADTINYSYKNSHHVLATPPRHYTWNTHPLRKYRRVDSHRNLLVDSSGRHFKNYCDWSNFRKPRGLFSKPDTRPPFLSHEFDGNISVNEKDPTIENVLQSLEAERFFKKIQRI